MDTNTLVVIQAIGVFLALFGFWWRLDRKIDAVDTKLSGEIKEVRLASEAAHKEINEKLTGIQVTQATHSERFNTVNEQFNGVSEQFNAVGEQFNAVGERFNAVNERLSAVQTQVKSLDDKVDRLRDGK